MCMSTPKDNSAEIARQAELERQRKITEGRQAIDQSFAGFDDSFYNQLSTGYQDYYLPQVDQQFNNARKKLIFSLARAGNLNASAGSSQLGDLKRKYEESKALIGNEAFNRAQQARADVERNKGDLYSQLSASADPASAAAAATARASALTAPPSYSPIGDIFASFLNTAATGVAAEKAGYPGFNTGLFSPKKSSVSVVN